MNRENVNPTPFIVVLGAINQDEVARVHRLPQPGETVVTDSLEVHQGGKAANQAYAAARAAGGAARVRMLGAIGDDPAGDAAIRSLKSVGVDARFVRRVLGRPTGRAYITVSDEGENSIVVGLGANADVSPKNIVGSRKPDLILGQTEVGSPAIEALVRFALCVGARVVINNGPVVQLSAEALEAADPLIVNEHEAADMLRLRDSQLEPKELVSRLRGKFGCRSVVVTLGSRGSVVADRDGLRAHPAQPVSNVVDTTGAGDTYVGVLALHLSLGLSLDQAIERATSAAARSVTVHGAR
ncbi:MAG: ribokinase [Rhodococcus sp. (in: high G+C Gram-positive bacteria)]